MADSTPTRKLTSMATRFVDEYLIDLNASAAAIRAGYSRKTAYQLAYRLLQDARVRAALKVRMDERAAATRIKAYRVLEELSSVAFSNIDHYAIDVDGAVTVKPDAPSDALRAVAKIRRKTRIIPQPGKEDIVVHETEISLWDKNSAIEKAMKHLGIISDKVETRDLTLESLILDAAHADDGATEPK
jgi:phage terminase small subunit